jgi:hypothetical protein
MILSRVMEIDACKTMGFAGVGAGYLAIGTPLDNTSRALIIQNDTDVKIWFTNNPLINKLPLAAGKSLVLDISSNKQSDEGFIAARGTQFYVKAYAALPGSGDIHITAITDIAD